MDKCSSFITVQISIAKKEMADPPQCLWRPFQHSNKCDDVIQSVESDAL
jgi:hypothetical protein